MDNLVVCACTSDVSDDPEAEEGQDEGQRDGVEVRGCVRFDADARRR